MRKRKLFILLVGIFLTFYICAGTTIEDFNYNNNLGKYNEKSSSSNNNPPSNSGNTTSSSYSSSSSSSSSRAYSVTPLDHADLVCCALTSFEILVKVALIVMCKFLLDE